MSYKGFIDADGKVTKNTYGELTYTMRGDLTMNNPGDYLFKEKGMFDESAKLISGQRDIDDGYWKIVGEI